MDRLIPLHLKTKSYDSTLGTKKLFHAQNGKGGGLLPSAEPQLTVCGIDGTNIGSNGSEPQEEVRGKGITVG